MLMSKLILVLYKTKYHCDDKEPEVSCSVINVNIYVCEVFLNVYILFALRETKELLFFAWLLFSLSFLFPFNVVLSLVSVD